MENNVDNLNGNVRFAGLEVTDKTGKTGVILNGRGRDLIIAGCASLGTPGPADNEVVWVTDDGIVVFSVVDPVEPIEMEGA